MSEILITQKKLECNDALSNRLRLTYSLFESSNEYKVEVTKDQTKHGISVKETVRTHSIISYDDAIKVIKIFAKNKVTPISINDVLEDFYYIKSSH